MNDPLTKGKLQSIVYSLSEWMYLQNIRDIKKDIKEVKKELETAKNLKLPIDELVEEIK